MTGAAMGAFYLKSTCSRELHYYTPNPHAAIPCRRGGHHCYRGCHL